MKIWIGIDNGISGTIGIIGEDGVPFEFFKTPTIFGQDYTKAKKNISRIDSPKLLEILKIYAPAPNDGIVVKALVERPLVNPTRFNATTSALRSFEATLVILEALAIPYQFIDSKEWQKALLPKGIKGAEELKKASLDIGKRLFPGHVLKHPDMDGILIAEYGRRNNL